MFMTPLRSSTALVTLLSLAAPVAAQAQDTPGAGFLGTLFLTFGKRDIAVGSAVAQTVVDQDEIEDRQAGTIAQLIDSVPGVTLVNGNTPQGSGINIRGFGANNTYGTDQKVAIQIDGASVGSEELYRIGTQLFTDPLLYREATVLRGTIGSFAYGSGIVGGVVKLDTKNASDFTGGEHGLAVGQTAEYSSNGEGVSSSTTLAWQPNDQAEFLLNFSYRSYDDYLDGDGDVVGNTAFTTPSALAKARFTFGEMGDQSLTFSVSRTVADDKDVPYDQFATTGGSFGNVDRLTDTTQASVEYGYNPLGNDLVDFTANLSYADQKIEYDYVPGSSPLEGTPSFPFLVGTVNADQRYETTKLKLANTARFGTGGIGHSLETGVEVQERRRKDNEAASAPGGTDDRLAVYAIDEMRLGRFTVTPALRFESARVTPANDSFDSYENDALMGGLALAYEFDNGFAVFGSAAYTEGLPIIDDLGDTAAAIDKMTTSEKSETYELGASFGGADVFAAGDTLAVRGNLYRTELWDITSYASLERVNVQGFDLEASYGLQNGLYVDLNAHIGHGEETDTAGDTERWRIQAADTVNLTVGKRWNDRLDLSWEVVHGTDRRDSAVEALPNATVHNLRATFRPEQGVFQETEFRVGLENAFDLDYVGHLSSPERKAPGRTFKFGVTKVF